MYKLGGKFVYKLFGARTHIHTHIERVGVPFPIEWNVIPKIDRKGHHHALSGVCVWSLYRRLQNAHNHGAPKTLRIASTYLFELE